MWFGVRREEFGERSSERVVRVSKNKVHSTWCASTQHSLLCTPYIAHSTTNSITFLFLLKILIMVMLQRLTLGLLLLLAIGCQKEEVAPSQLPPPEVDVIEVMKMDVPLYAEYVGQVYGFKDIPIRARVEGFLESIHFDEGFPVKKGQLLYTIDSQPFEANVASYKSNVAEAETELVRAESELNRYESLIEQKAVSQSDYDATKAQYGAAVAAVEAAEANLEMAQIQLGYCKIYSPLNGIIGKTQAKIGEFVGKDPNPVILNTVSEIDKIRVEFFLPEAQYLTIAREVNLDLRDRSRRNVEEQVPNLELILADGTTHEFKGKADFIDREVDPSTGSLLVQSSFPNPDGIVRPGQYAKVRILLQTLKDATVVPQRCISELQGQFSVKVVKSDNTIENRTVKPSERMGDLWLITEGIEHGEKVVISGLQRIKSGMEVNPKVTTFESQNSEG